MNQILLIGKVKAEPTLKETSNGILLGQLLVDVQRPYKTDGQKAEIDTFCVTLWRGLAEEVKNSSRPGAVVVIKGRLQANNFMKDDGEMIYRSELIAEKVCFIEND